VSRNRRPDGIDLDPGDHLLTSGLELGSHGWIYARTFPRGLLFGDVTASMRSGILFEPPDYDMVFVRGEVDEEGWKALSAIYLRAFLESNASEPKAKTAWTRAERSRFPSRRSR